MGKTKDKGEKCMSRADELYIQTCKDILENGFYDTDLEVRPIGRMVLLPIP